MSIKIGRVEIEKFLSIEKASINFSDRGLVAVLGPNGVGKSSLIVEALEYGWFGVSERYGNERDKIVNRFFGKDCHLHIPAYIDDMVVEVDVYRKHHKYKDEVFLKINGEDQRGRTNAHTWGKIGKILDMDHISFINSIVHSTSQFASLPDADQKAIIERLLVSWIPRAYEISTRDRDVVDRALSSSCTDYDNLRKKLEEVDSELEFYSKKYENFESERLEKIKKLEEEFVDITKSENEVKELEDRIKGLEGEAKKLEDTLTRKKDVEAEIRKMDLEVRELEVKLGFKEKEIKKVEGKAENTKSFEEKTRCESCGQIITAKSQEQYLAHLAEDVAKLKEEAKTLRSQLNKVKDDKAPVESQYKELLETEKQNKALTQKIEMNRRELSSSRIANAKVEEKNRSVVERIGELREQENSFLDVVDKLKESKRGTSEEFATVEQRCRKEAEEKKYCDFVVDLYSNKGLKSFIIESVLPDMDRFASIYSRALGGKYEISFSPQTVLKKGEVREKFAVNVINRYGADTYEGNSSGEKQAVDTIVMFVLGDLAASRLNKSVSLLVLDDIFEKLDAQVCESVINVLKMMATPRDQRDKEFRDLPERESIFVLSHLEQFKNRFENKMIIRRDSNGQMVIDDE